MAVNTTSVSGRIVDGRSYNIDDHGMIRGSGPFKDLPLYVPYLWEAYLDGAFDEEVCVDGVNVIVFAVTDDDRRDYPELSGATKVFVWEDSSGRLNTRLDRVM